MLFRSLRQIVALQIRRVQRRLADQKITLAISDPAIDFIVHSGYDPVYGARPLKRAIQRLLENPIATKILQTTFTEGSAIGVDLLEAELVFNIFDRPEDLPFTQENPQEVAVAMASPSPAPS